MDRVQGNEKINQLLMPLPADQDHHFKVTPMCLRHEERHSGSHRNGGVVIVFMVLMAMTFLAPGMFMVWAGQPTIPAPNSKDPGETGIVQRMETNSGEQSSPYADAPEPKWGSPTVLESCWSPEELAGSAADKRIIGTGAAPPRACQGRTFLHNIGKPLPAELRSSIRSVKPDGNRKLIALTFDLCESANEISGYDAEIVNYLRRNQVKATFFAGGKWMCSHPEKTMQLMADPLFEIGNHSWTHPNFRRLDRQGIAEQVLRTQAQYQLLREELTARPCARRCPPEELSKIPKAPLTFRFPYGACNKEALDFLASSGLPAIQWSVVTGDPAPGQTAGVISREILEKTRPGAIIICHANGRGHGTAGALPLFIPKLIQSGYEFVTISELLASGSAIAVGECYAARPGDNIHDDRLWRFGKE